MLVVKYYEYYGKDDLYKVKCEKFYSCYPVEDDSMIFVKDSEAVVIEIRKILSIGVVNIESCEKE